MRTIVENFWWVLPILLALPYLGLPLVIWQTFHIKYPTTVLPIELADLDLPTDVALYMVPMGHELEKLGFRNEGCFGLPDLVPNVVSCNLLMTNEKAKVGAMVSCVCGTGSGSGLKTKYIEFVSRYSGRYCIQTNNWRELSAFRNPPEVQTTKFWDIRNVEQLFKLHQQIAARKGLGQPRLTLHQEFDGDLTAYINHCVIEEICDYQVEIGRLRRVDGGYGATFKGAFIFVWQELWPLKPWRRYSEWKKARVWLKEASASFAKRTPLRNA